MSKKKVGLPISPTVKKPDGSEGFVPDEVRNSFFRRRWLLLGIMCGVKRVGFFGLGICVVSAVLCFLGGI